MITIERLDYLEHLHEGGSAAPWHRAHDDVPQHPCKCGQIWSDSDLLFAPVRSMDDECAERPRTWWMSRISYLRQRMILQGPTAADAEEVKNHALALGWHTWITMDNRCVLENVRFPMRQITIPMDEKADDFEEVLLRAVNKLIDLEKIVEPESTDPRAADGRLIVESRNSLKDLIAAARKSLSLQERLDTIAGLLQNVLDNEDADTDDLLSVIRAAVSEAKDQS